jgi:hypothetical protein
MLRSLSVALLLTAPALSISSLAAELLAWRPSEKSRAVLAQQTQEKAPPAARKRDCERQQEGVS